MKTYIDQLVGDIAQSIRNRQLEVETRNAEREKELSTADEEYRSKVSFARHIAEVERYLESDPPADQNLYYHFGYSPQQFPPVEQLTDDQTERLATAILELWKTFNIDAYFPNGLPARILYPLLLQKMHQPTFIMEEGWSTHEFCSYECENCPFGLEWCMCKDFGDTTDSSS